MKTKRTDIQALMQDIHAVLEDNSCEIWGTGVNSDGMGDIWASIPKTADGSRGLHENVHVQISPRRFFFRVSCRTRLYSVSHSGSYSGVSLVDGKHVQKTHL